MLETIRAWLNGTRDYNMGVAIYSIVGKDEKLKDLFKKGYSLNNNYRLVEQLKAICEQLKLQQNERAKTQIYTSTTTSQKQTPHFKTEINKPAATVSGTESELDRKDIQKTEAVNTALYQSCLNEANMMYKEAMNARAVLFNSIPTIEYSDVNRPDLVAQRRQLAIDVVNKYNEASRLYDRADYVKKNGCLPDGQQREENNDLDDLPDFLVYSTLDNLRKNYNKIKNRAESPERVQLLQEHEANIKKLEDRWHLLKQRPRK